MRIELGATVKTNDGHRAGTVTKVIWDPAENQVSEFVVGTGGLLGHDVVVSREVLEQATPDGKELVIDLTKHELEGLEHFDDHAYAAPPYGWQGPAESLSLIHISEPTRLLSISYAVFCLKKKKT